LGGTGSCATDVFLIQDVSTVPVSGLGSAPASKAGAACFAIKVSNDHYVIPKSVSQLAFADTAYIRV
jgi:hypothetical protein